MPKPKLQARQLFIEIKHFDAEPEIDRALEKLNKCKTLLDELWDYNAAHDDPRKYELDERIRTTTLEIFGPNSPEYGRLRHYRIWHGSQYVNMPREQIQAGFRAGFPHTGVMLKGLMDRLGEAREELACNSKARTRATFQGPNLHPRIAEASRELYQDSHYRQAVLDGSIALTNYVKEKSRRHELDGASLMSTVFSANSPVLAFNALADQTEKDEQQGMMHLFLGATPALRNPRAHSIFDDSPELALDAIAFLSMLAKRLDGAKRTTRTDDMRTQN
jgi:uncharacterized protein (TIGR02391 family)